MVVDLSRATMNQGVGDTICGVVTTCRAALPEASSCVEYWPEGPDTLAGRYQATAGGDTWERFVRVAPDLLHSAAALPHPVWGEAIRIPHAVGTLAGL